MLCNLLPHIQNITHQLSHKNIWRLNFPFEIKYFLSFPRTAEVFLDSIHIQVQYPITTPNMRWHLLVWERNKNSIFLHQKSFLMQNIVKMWPHRQIIFIHLLKSDVSWLTRARQKVHNNTDRTRHILKSLQPTQARSVRQQILEAVCLRCSRHHLIELQW